MDGFKFKVMGYKCDLPETHQISQIVLGVLETTFDGVGDQFNWKGDIPDQVLRYLKGELEAYIKIPIVQIYAAVFDEPMHYVRTFHVALKLKQTDIDNYGALNDKWCFDAEA